MSIVIDLPRKRIYIRGDIYKANRWMKRYFAEKGLESPLMLFSETTTVVDSAWTFEHNPEPL